MLRNIFITAAFFVVIMLALLVADEGQPAVSRACSPNRGEVRKHCGRSKCGGTRTGGSRGRTWNRSDAKGEFKSMREPDALTNRSSEPGRRGAVHGLAGEPVLLDLRVLPGVEPDQLPVAGAASKRAEPPRANPAFLIIASTVAIGQIVIVSLGGSVFNVTPLSVTTWLGVAGVTLTVLVFAEICAAFNS